MPIDQKYTRDIDLLLAEELLASPPFAAWFRDQTRFRDQLAEVIDVGLSADAGEGELAVYYRRADGGVFALLIQNVFDSSALSQQVDGYLQRARQLVNEGVAREVTLVLGCPEAYIVAQHGAELDLIPCRITFEAMADALLALDDTARSRYRADFLRTALVRRIDVQNPPVESATDAFWRRALALANAEFPMLEMKATRHAAGETWTHFRPHDMPSVPKHVSIQLKGDRGFVDLSFRATDAAEFSKAIDSCLSLDMQVKQTHRAAVVRMLVDPFRVSQGWTAVEPTMRAAFKAAARLIQFFRDNREVLLSAARQASLPPR